MARDHTVRDAPIVRISHMSMSKMTQNVNFAGLPLMGAGVLLARRNPTAMDMAIISASGVDQVLLGEAVPIAHRALTKDEYIWFLVVRRSATSTATGLI